MGSTMYMAGQAGACQHRRTRYEMDATGCVPLKIVCAQCGAQLLPVEKNWSPQDAACMRVEAKGYPCTSNTPIVSVSEWLSRTDHDDKSMNAEGAD